MPKLADHLTLETCLPQSGLLVGRVWNPGEDGPSVVRVDGDRVLDITASFPTMRDLCETDDPAGSARAAEGEIMGGLAAILANTAPETRNAAHPWLLPPIDLQCVKAAGVTFATSMLERVIEERARGNPEAAADIRKSIGELIGDDLSKLKPGSPQAMKLKQVLIEKGVWSQYLEVGIGPDAEIFTKSQVLSSVGHGMEAGLNAISTWNNPEPEVVVVVASSGRIVGATLGNDVNLRDVEGRSGLLLGKAKD
ncbi:MAG: fumarylacetoacetate hydrolase, partial [Aestuariivirga sp.]